MILEDQVEILENQGDLADFEWMLIENIGEKVQRGLFIRINFGLLENLVSILEDQKAILDNREHLLAEVRDILEVRKFIRTNKNILEHYKIY